MKQRTVEQLHGGLTRDIAKVDNLVIKKGFEVSLKDITELEIQSLKSRVNFFYSKTKNNILTFISNASDLKVEIPKVRFSLVRKEESYRAIYFEKFIPDYSSKNVYDFCAERLLKLEGKSTAILPLLKNDMIAKRIVTDFLCVISNYILAQKDPLVIDVFGVQNCIYVLDKNKFVLGGSSFKIDHNLQPITIRSVSEVVNSYWGTNTRPEKDSNDLFLLKVFASCGFRFNEICLSMNLEPAYSEVLVGKAWEIIR